MKTLTTFLLLFLFSTPAISAGIFSSSEWSKEEKILQGIFYTVALKDWEQTLDISTHPGQKELNPLLGTAPSNRKINKLFTLGLIGHTVLANQLNHKWRRNLQYFSIGWIGKNVFLNFQSDRVFGH